jgi:hypothetical protein
MITFFVVYVGIGRPVRNEIDQLRGQVKLLQSGIEQLVAVIPTASASTDLLAELTAQKQQLAEAQFVVDQVASLRSRLTDEAQGVTYAEDALDDLAELKDAILATSDRVHYANDVLNTSQIIQDRLAGAEPVVMQAFQASEVLMQTADLLSGGSAHATKARQMVRDLLEMQRSLEAQEESIGSASESLDDLLMLKDSILARTHNLADAIETLELTQDLNDQLQRAVASFRSIRQWMLEVVATEPVVLQAREALSPLLDLADLRRLDMDELRAVARNFRARQQPGSESFDDDRQLAVDSNDVDWDAPDFRTAQPAMKNSGELRPR